MLLSIKALFYKILLRFYLSVWSLWEVAVGTHTVLAADVKNELNFCCRNVLHFLFPALELHLR